MWLKTLAYSQIIRIGVDTMAECIYCGSETELFDNSAPICIQRSQEQEAKRKPPASQQGIRAALLQDLLGATARCSDATRRFGDVMGRFPSGLPHPDGVRIARKEMATAHNRLNDFLNRGIVPDELKRNG
jgi:hypothetical protein